jgi:hypothetical protein
MDTEDSNEKRRKMVMVGFGVFAVVVTVLLFRDNIFGGGGSDEVEAIEEIQY